MPERVSDIGEFGLIRRISDLLNKEGIRSERVTVGIGDDTASFLQRPGYELLVTCDCMVEGRHYLPGKISSLDLGRRAMTLNISDIGAMGGRPLYALISLGLKAEVLVQYVEEMYRGFLLELRPFGASIIGGNLTKSGDGMFIDITLIGEVEQGKGLRRSGAKPGDVILVYRFINIFTLESMSEIEFFPAMHNWRIVDFPNSQQDSFFKFLFGIHTNVLQESSGHFTEERFDKI